MCMEDIRLGRRSPVGVRTLTLDGGDQPLLSPAPSRVSLVICAPSSGTVTLTVEVAATEYQGIVLAAGQPPLILDVHRHGELVTRGWRVRSSPEQHQSRGGVTDEWDETGTATAAVATATHAAVANSLYYVTGLAGGFSAATVGATLDLRDDVTVIQRYRVDTSLVVGLLTPVPITRGNACSAVLSAGAALVVGDVVIRGFTVGQQTITVYEVSLPET